jgi:hypothetical protein
MTTDSLLDMIRRLLALSSSHNEHEARAALAKAQELCLRHNLSLEEVEASAAAAEGWEESSGWIGGATIPFHVHLARMIVDRYFFVRTVSVTHISGRRGKPRQKELCLFGRSENVAVARHVLLYLVRTFWALWRDYRRRRTAGSYSGRTSGLYRPYVLGVAQGLQVRLEAERTAARCPATAGALVRVKGELDRRFAEANPGIQTVRGPKPVRANLEGELAMLEGRHDGQTISIRPDLSQEQRLLIADDSSKS